MDSNTEINVLIQHTCSLKCSDNEPQPTPFDNEYALIAEVLTEKTINMAAFKTTILRAWSPKKKVNINLLQPNLAFIFEDEADALKVYNLSWTFRDFQVIVCKWPPDKALYYINLNRAIFWIQAHNIHVCFVNLSRATSIGNSIGSFIKADLNSAANKWKRFLRIQVEIDILNPIKSSVSLPCSGRPNLLVEIRYERLSDFCFKCGLLGHKILNCNVAICDDNMEISDASFGPWIKADNTLVHNPLFKTVTTPNPYHLPNSRNIPITPKQANHPSPPKPLVTGALNSNNLLPEKPTPTADKNQPHKAHVACPDWTTSENSLCNKEKSPLISVSNQLFSKSKENAHSSFIATKSDASNAQISIVLNPDSQKNRETYSHNFGPGKLQSGPPLIDPFLQAPFGLAPSLWANLKNVKIEAHVNKRKLETFSSNLDPTDMDIPQINPREILFAPIHSPKNLNSPNHYPIIPLHISSDQSIPTIKPHNHYNTPSSQINK